MLTSRDKEHIVNHLDSYRISLEDFTFTNKDYERTVKASIKGLIAKLREDIDESIV